MNSITELESVGLALGKAMAAAAVASPSDGLCRCGCGEPAPLAPFTMRRRGHVKGQPQKYILGHSAKGKPVKGYRGQAGRREHVIVAEQALGKALPVGAEVHHVDGNKSNNVNTNLVICQDHSYHFLLHARARTVRAGGDPNAQQVCSVCKQAKDFGEFWKDKNNTSYGLQSRCRACSRTREIAETCERCNGREVQGDTTLCPECWAVVSAEAIDRLPYVADVEVF